MQGALPILVKCMQSSLLKQAKMAFLQQLIRLDKNRASSNFPHFCTKSVLSLIWTDSAFFIRVLPLSMVK